MASSLTMHAAAKIISRQCQTEHELVNVVVNAKDGQSTVISIFDVNELEYRRTR